MVSAANERTMWYYGINNKFSSNFRIIEDILDIEDIGYFVLCLYVDALDPCEVLWWPGGIWFIPWQTDNLRCMENAKIGFCWYLSTSYQWRHMMPPKAVKPVKAIPMLKNMGVVIGLPRISWNGWTAHRMLLATPLNRQVLMQCPVLKMDIVKNPVFVGVHDDGTGKFMYNSTWCIGRQGFICYQCRNFWPLHNIYDDGIELDSGSPDSEQLYRWIFLFFSLDRSKKEEGKKKENL